MGTKCESKVVLRGGSSIVGCRPIFSTDSKYLITASGSGVKLYSVLSGECVRGLRGHKGQVTGIALNPANQFQLLTCSQDGFVIKWDYTDGTLLKRWEIGSPLFAVFPTSLEDGRVLLIRKQTRRASELVYFVPSKNAEERNDCVSLLDFDGDAHARLVALGHNSKFVAAAKNNSLIAYILKRDSIKEHKCDKGWQLTCVASHPTENCVATGCKSGEIILWWNVLSSKKVVKTVHHWHALPVQCLAYTTHGSYLMSGGHENVLVKWQHNSEHKDTFPRLGSPLVNVTCSRDNNLYATCHANNMIQIITNNFKVTQVIQGLTQGHLVAQNSNSIPTGLLLDPRTKALVLNGRVGHLQFYNIHKDVQLYNLDIVGQNFISPASIERPLVYTEIEQAAFDPLGLWLATVERRDDKETAPEMRLKFWKFDKQSQKFVLNTNVELPHDDHVCSLRFRPGSPDSDSMAVTAGADGRFKLWTIRDDTDIYRENQCWQCESVGYYQDVPATQADFSEDGSLLVVSFGSTLTLWNPDNNSLRQTMPQGDHIRHVLFGKQRCCHLLMCSTDSRLLVWNLLSCSLQWSLPEPVQAMAQDPLSSHVAAFTDKHQLLVFEPSGSSILYTLDDVSTSGILSAIFIPHSRAQDRYSKGELLWQSKSQLYFMTKKQELLTIALSSEEETSPTEQKIEEHLPVTPFSQLLSTRRTQGHLGDEGRTTATASLDKDGKDFVQQLLTTPAHVLPPISSLCLTFMNHLLIKNKQQVNRRDNDDDSESEDEGDMDKSDSSESEMEVDDEERQQHKPSTAAQDQSETKTVFSVGDSSLATLSENQIEKQFEQSKHDMFTWINLKGDGENH